MHAWVWICAVTKILPNNYRLNQLSVMNFYYYLTLEYTHADQRAEPTTSIVCVHIHILFKVFIIAVFIFHVFFSSFPFSFPFSLSLFFALSWNAVNIWWFTSHKQIRKNECSVHLDDAAWKIVAARFFWCISLLELCTVFFHDSTEKTGWFAHVHSTAQHRQSDTLNYWLPLKEQRHCIRLLVDSERENVDFTIMLRATFIIINAFQIDV